MGDMIKYSVFCRLLIASDKNMSIPTATPHTLNRWARIANNLDYLLYEHMRRISQSRGNFQGDWVVLVEQNMIQSIIWLMEVPAQSAFGWTSETGKKENICKADAGCFLFSIKLMYVCTDTMHPCTPYISYTHNHKASSNSGGWIWPA